MDNNIKTYIGYEFEVEENITELIKKSSKITKHTCPPNQYHETKRNTTMGEWRVEKDESLSDGAEFITPVEEMEQSFKTMKNFFSIVTSTNSKTSSRCGCHTNMCLMHDNKIIKLDLCCILSNINWRLIYSLWKNRIGVSNIYCKYITKLIYNIKHGISHVEGLRKDNIDNSKKSLSRAIFNQYHGFIVQKKSLTTSPGKYYELRFLGGKNYHCCPDKIETTVRHFDKVFRNSIKGQNKNKNKKIISYINRILTLKLPTNNINNNEHIEQLSNIRKISDIYKNPKFNSPCNKTLQDMIGVKNSIYNVFTNVDILDKTFVYRLISKINNEYLIYYMIKYFVINSYRNIINNNIELDVLEFNKIKLIIPYGERDADKLWLIKIFNSHLLKDEERKNIIGSIRDKKIKEYFIR